MKKLTRIQNKLAIVLGIVFLTNYSLIAQTTETFSTPGTTTWTVPACVNSITVQVWAGGGGGGAVWSRFDPKTNSPGSNEICPAAGGGGGGGFVSRTYTVVPGQTYNITVGAGGIGGVINNSLSSNRAQNGSAGGNSIFSGPATAGPGTLTAFGGSGGFAANIQRSCLGGCSGATHQGANGNGGSGNGGSNGTTTFFGGNGSAGVHSGSTEDRSGAGGGGAGSAANGGNASGTSAGSGGSLLGGNGANGNIQPYGNGYLGTNGQNGNTIGGGGGGASGHNRGQNNNTHRTNIGGNGARGEVQITYSGGTPPIINLSNTIDTICVSSSITFTGNTFSNTTGVTILENGAGSVDVSSASSSPFNFTYTPSFGDVGNTVSIGVISNDMGCGIDTSIISFFVKNKLDPIFSLGSICYGESSPLPAISNNGFSGTWSPAFDSTVTTFYTFTPNPGECANSSSLTITVIPEKTGTVNNTICFEDAGMVVNGTTYDASNPSGIEVISNVGPNNCDSTVTINLNVIPEKTGTVSNTICTYDSVIVNGVTYNASNPLGTEVITNVGPNNCDSTVTINLTITPDPVVGITTASECENVTGSGQVLNIDVTALDAAINSSGVVTWYTDNTYSSSYTPNNETVNNGDVYYFEVTQNGCTVQDSITHYVSDNIVLNDPNPQFCEDVAGGGSVANVNLTTYNNAVFAGASSYTWATGPAGVTINDGDSINIEVHQGSCPTVDIFVHFTVNPLPTSNPSSMELCEDAAGSGQASFDLTSVDNTVNGGTANVVAWFDDALATSPIGTPGAFVTGNDTVYAVVTDGTTLCMDTTDVYLIIDPLPVANDQTPQLCEDAGTPGTVSGVDLTLLNNSIDGGAGNTLTWYTDAGLASPVGTPNNTSVNDNDVFYVLVDNGTCSDTAMVTYTVTSTIVLTAPAPVLCEETLGSGNVTNIDLTSYNSSVYSGGAATFNWFTDAGLTTPVGTPTNVTVSNGTSFYVDVTDGSCNNNDTLTFTVNAQSTGVYTETICFGDSTTVNGTVYSAANGLTGTEIFTSANNCDSTVTVTITELPLITGTIDSTVCNGGSFVFNGTTYDAANPTGTETLLAASGCDSIVTVTLTELPLITNQVLDNICNGDSYTFPEGTATNLTADTTHVSTLTAVSGCDSVVTFIITVNPALSVNPTVTDTSICLGDALVLTATSSGNGTVTWYSDAAGTTVAGTGTSFTPNFTGGGTYTFYVQEEANGCISTGGLIPVTVNVSEVTASVNADPISGLVPLEVSFTGTSTGNTFEWNFGDGTTGSSLEETHIYSELGTYTAVLTVSDNGNCPITIPFVIEVIGESSILIPNVFTPNGDGSNDVFTVVGTNLTDVNCVIFNRWGQKLYEWDRVKGYWDGRTLAGKEVPDGTYFFIVKAKGIDGKEYFEKGGFSLIR